VAVDVAPAALALATRLGAERATTDPDAVPTLTGGGAHLSLDAFGAPATAAAAVLGLRRRGRHVQVGLLPGGAHLPMDRMIGYELELRGSHGMPAHAYPEMLGLVGAGRLRPGDLVTGEITLDDVPRALSTMDTDRPAGVRVIRPR
jgi:threonine dehydrogenase-like Zn-dependent dehydrogenase